MRGLRQLARQIFVDRNAQGWLRPGMPKSERLDIKAEARPLLREAIHWLRKSRDALLAGDVERHELLRDRARMYRAFAALEFFQPYANKYGHKLVTFAKQSSEGGKEKAKAWQSERPELAGLDNLIRAALQRGDRRMPVKVWIEEYKLPKSTIYDRIKRIRTE